MMVQKIITDPGLFLSIRCERYVFAVIGQGYIPNPIMYQFDFSLIGFFVHNFRVIFYFQFFDI